MCKAAKGMLANFFLKSLSENFRSKITSEWKCPILAGSYNISDWRITEKFIPSFMLRNVSFRVDVDGKARLLGERSTVQMFTLKIIGKLVKPKRTSFRKT